MGSAHSQPVEVLDHIFSFVEKPCDLLHIALTAKRYRDVVIPHHIDYRVIRCDCRFVHLWEQLTELPKVASRFLILEIVEEGAPYKRSAYLSGRVVFPSSLVGGIDASDEDWASDSQAASLPLLEDAISGMTQLTRFSFLDGRGQEKSYSLALEHVFKALFENCKHLDDIEVMLDDKTNALVDFDFISTHLWKLSNLIRFAFGVNHTTGDQTAYTEYTELMVDMLVNRYPNLEDLEIIQKMDGHECGVMALKELFKKGRWPKLHRLSVGSVSLTTNNADEFFRSHPLLRQICIRGSSIGLAFHNLPNLRHLHLDYVPKPSEIADIAECLEGLVVTLPDFGYHNDPHIKELFVLTSRLRYLVLHDAFYDRDYLMSITHLAPTLERLAFVWQAHDDYVEAAIKNPDFFYRFISHFPLLTHLSGIDPDPDLHPSTYEVTCDDDYEKMVRTAATSIASTAPLLRFVELSMDLSSSWLRIERNRDGSLEGCYVNDDADYAQDVRVEIWGDLPCDAARRLEWLL